MLRDEPRSAKRLVAFADLARLTLGQLRVLDRLFRNGQCHARQRREGCSAWPRAGSRGLRRSSGRLPTPCLSRWPWLCRKHENSLRIVLRQLRSRTTPASAGMRPPSLRKYSFSNAGRVPQPAYGLLRAARPIRYGPAVPAPIAIEPNLRMPLIDGHLVGLPLLE